MKQLEQRKRPFASGGEIMSKQQVLHRIECSIRQSEDSCRAEEEILPHIGGEHRNGESTAPDEERQEEESLVASLIANISRRSRSCYFHETKKSHGEGGHLDAMAASSKAVADLLGEDSEQK